MARAAVTTPFGSIISSTWTGLEALAKSASAGYCGSGRAIAAFLRTSSEIRKIAGLTSSLLASAAVLVAGSGWVFVGGNGVGFPATFAGVDDTTLGVCVGAGLFASSPASASVRCFEGAAGTPGLATAGP